MSDPRRDPEQLAGGQYRDEANLRARAALHERFGTGAPWHPWVFGLLPVEPELRVLELGCGGGRFWQANARRVPSGWHLTLTDLSPGMLEATAATLGAAGLLPRLERLDASRLVDDARFPDDAYDVVLANHMLYHVPDLERTLRGVRRVLRPGGRLFAATNGADHLTELWELARAELPPGRWTDRGSLAFELENGAAWLEPHFASVTLHRRSDVLNVTDEDAVVDYVASLADVAGVPAEALAPDVARALAAVRDRVRAALDRHGAFTVRRSTGVFEAV